MRLLEQLYEKLPLVLPHFSRMFRQLKLLPNLGSFTPNSSPRQTQSLTTMPSLHDQWVQATLCSNADAVSSASE